MAERTDTSKIEGNPQGGEAPRTPCIWAMGGGKGGVGKSVVTSNLALALARRGKRCVLVDLDLGAANLHTLLGVQSPKLTLSHFLNRDVEDLNEVVARTPEPNLGLISGSRALLGMANPKHHQKQKLQRHIRKLDADHVFLDLSAGSAFNALDFYLEADYPILVVIPEPTSIENAYHFLKSAFFRSLADAAKKTAVRSAIGDVLKEKAGTAIRSPRDLITEVTRLDDGAGEALRKRAREFCPMLLVNQARTAEHRRLGPDIQQDCQRYLGARVEYLGALERDESVRVAVAQKRAVLDLFPNSPFAMDLEAVAVRLASGRFQDEPREPASRPARVAPPTPVAPGPVAAAQPAPTELTPPDLSKPGAALRRRRVQLALELPELYRRTRIRNLDKLEGEVYHELPPEPYVRAFVRQYADALGIRESEALADSYVDRYRRARVQA